MTAGAVRQTVVFQLAEKRIEVRELEVWNVNPARRLDRQDFLPRGRRADRFFEQVLDPDALRDAIFRCELVAKFAEEEVRLGKVDGHPAAQRMLSRTLQKVVRVAVGFESLFALL